MRRWSEGQQAKIISKARTQFKEKWPTFHHLKGTNKAKKVQMRPQGETGEQRNTVHSDLKA